MVRHNDAGLAPDAGAAATLAHRDAHEFLFEPEDKASLLEMAVPSLVWSRVGGLPALSAPDFRSLLLEGCLRLSADGGQTFGGHCPSLALFAGAWAEILRIAPEGHVLWTVGQERPDFVKALEEDPRQGLFAGVRRG